MFSIRIKMGRLQKYILKMELRDGKVRLKKKNHLCFESKQLQMCLQAANIYHEESFSMQV